MLYTGFECSLTFLLIWGFAGVTTGFFQFIGLVFVTFPKSRRLEVEVTGSNPD